MRTTSDAEILKRQVTVQAEDQVKNRFKADPDFTYHIVDGSLGLVDGDSFSGALGREPGEKAGIYAITNRPEHGGDLYISSDYDLVVKEGHLTIKEVFMPNMWNDSSTRGYDVYSGVSTNVRELWNAQDSQMISLDNNNVGDVGVKIGGIETGAVSIGEVRDGEQFTIDGGANEFEIGTDADFGGLMLDAADKLLSVNKLFKSDLDEAFDDMLSIVF